MKTIELGNIQIDRVVELERWAFAANKLFPSITPDIIDIGKNWLDQRFIDPPTNDLILGVHSFLIRINGRTILVDTCNGNHKNRPSLPSRSNLNTSYLSNLKRAGAHPEDIDIVLCTHLHPDHSGWNTRLSDGEWIPTFPNAKYLVSAKDFEYAQNLYDAGREQSATNDMVEMFDDSVLPIVQSKQIELVDTNHVVAQEIGNGIWMESASGHTPGHIFIHAKQEHNRAIFTGDVIHHPIQLDALHLSNASDVDPIMAEKTRRQLVERYTDTDTIILTGHFAGPTAGRIIIDNNAFRFRWMKET